MSNIETSNMTSVIVPTDTFYGVTKGHKPGKIKTALAANEYFKGSNYNRVRDVQQDINSKLNALSKLFGKDLGNIAVDGHYGEQTESALNFVKKYYDEYGQMRDEVRNYKTPVAATTTSSTTGTTTDPKSKWGTYSLPDQRAVSRSSYNRADLRNGLRYYDNTQSLRLALQSDQYANDPFITDLRNILHNRGYDINNNIHWSQFLKDADLNGGIGAKDRKDLRLWMNGNSNNYNMLLQQQGFGNRPTPPHAKETVEGNADKAMTTPPPQKKQKGGKIIDNMSDEEVVKLFEGFLKDNNLKPSEDNWNLFLEVLKESVTKAEFGAKLNYIQRITKKCPAGTELQHFKVGGKVCSACMGKKIKKMPQHKTDDKMLKGISPAVDAFRNRRKK